MAAWHVYENSNHAQVMISGRLQQGEVTKDSITDTLRHLYGINPAKYSYVFNKPEEGIQVTGAVLHIVDPVRKISNQSAIQWSVGINEAWLLGGIHRQLDFIMASPLTRDNICGKPPTMYTSTVTGWECISLKKFGFTFNSSEGVLGHGVWKCADGATARSATIHDIHLFHTTRTTQDFESFSATF